MSMVRRVVSFSPVGLAVLFAFTPPASAVIKLDITPAKIYETSRTVLVGSVINVDRLLAIKVADVLKGDSPGELLRVQIVAPAELNKNVAVGSPVIFCSTRQPGVAMIHAANQWLIAREDPATNPRIWRVMQVYEPNMKAFPGRTSALVRVFAALKAGKNPLLDKVEQKFFSGEPRKLAKLDLEKPAWMLAADFNGDGRSDLLVGAAKPVRLLLANPGGLADATKAWGLDAATGEYRAAGDINGDGKPDLLLDDTVWINDGEKFTASKARLDPPRGSKPLAAAILDMTGDNKADAIFVSADGELRAFANPGAADQPWPPRAATQLWKGGSAPAAAFFGDFGDNGKPHVIAIRESGIIRYALGADAEGGPAADFQRLTGISLAKQQQFAGGLKNVRALGLDVNGDRRPDLLVLCDTGAFILINRGFGAFLLDPDAGAAMKASQLSPSGVFAAAGVHSSGADDLLVLTGEGTLYEVPNQPKK